MADPTSVVATQSATNSGAVTNFTIDTLSVGDLSGDVTSLSGSASGATASVSVVNLGTTGGAANDGTNDVALGTTEGLGLTQSAINSGTVTNIGDDATTGADLTTGNLSGTMSSVRSSAIGASASVSVLNVNSLIEADTTIGSYTDAANSADISQTATNTGTVVNGVTDSQNTIAVTGDLSGDGASASSSASGASASVSVSNVWASDSTLPTAVDTNHTTTISSVTQTVTNGDDTGTDATIGAVSNYGSIAVDGSLSGVRTNAIVSATGASAGVSVANIGTATDGTPTVGAELDTTISPVSQTSSNYANVINGTADDPSTVSITGELSGTATAAS